MKRDTSCVRQCHNYHALRHDKESLVALVLGVNLIKNFILLLC